MHVCVRVRTSSSACMRARVHGHLPVSVLCVCDKVKKISFFQLQSLDPLKHYQHQGLRGMKIVALNQVKFVLKSLSVHYPKFVLIIIELV